jgi:BirA family biotin operon repressor/biotin-[acetyl-CoA-carboxylase] ligase
MFNKIIHYTKVESTNSLLSKLVKEKKIHDNLVVVADYQTNGRGQRNKKWHSAKNKNLLFSIYIRTDNYIVDQKNYFNMITSLSIIYTLKNYIKDSRIEIKSPNDILVDGHKISGILIETAILKSKIKTVIIGVGINVNQKRFSFIENSPTSISNILKYNINTNTLLDVFLKNFTHLFAYFKEKKYTFLDKEYFSFLKESS